jgi:L-methionine (R)-S-oxide reductase
LRQHGGADLSRPLRVNWAGFYFARQGELVLGPFQGKPACIRIAWGEGVCGAAAARGSAIVVPDVHEFPGHIACDPESRSELVVPLVDDGRVLGVLDLDSPVAGRFDEDDRAGCERLVAIFLGHQLRWPEAFT